MLTIWGRLNSHNVKKVAWLAQEIGMPHRRHDIGGKFGFTDAYLAMNPNRLIPTIEDDGFVLWESNAILRYMAARYAPSLWPDDPQARATADQWMDWQFGYADAQRDAFINFIRRTADQRDAVAIAQSAKASAAQMEILNDQLGKTAWLSGDAFGIGDVPMGVYAYTYFTLDIPRPALPHVERWYDALKSRSGYVDQVMIGLS